MTRFKPNLAFTCRVLLVVLVIWLLVLLLFSNSWRSGDGDVAAYGDDPLLNELAAAGGTGSENELILARLSRAASELTSLKAQNEELRNWLNTYFPPPEFPNGGAKFNERTGKVDYPNGLDTETMPPKRSATLLASLGPSKEAELARRRLESNIHEIWFYARHQLDPPQVKLITELRGAMLTDLRLLAQRDDHWRRTMLNKLADYIQTRIRDLQNPIESCGTVRKLKCHLNKGCGFGCQIHHLTYCFVVAMATNRTLILDAKNWRYTTGLQDRSTRVGWESVFQPLSDNCLDPAGATRASWGSADAEEAQVLELPIVDSMRPRPKFLPLTIPSQIGDTLVRLHGAPIVFFLGQIVRYIMRPSAEMQKIIDQTQEKFGYRHPIVGIHVRRTDKVGTEARFHSVDEYMQFVADWYDRLDQEAILLSRPGDDIPPPAHRLVYLATDDHKLWSRELEAWRKKGYLFLGDSLISKSAGVGRRYAIESLKNIILDIWLLSRSDYLVCTFSSQVCRLAYELMNTRTNGGQAMWNLTDWSRAFYSLDDIYYFGGQHDHNEVALLPNVPQATTSSSKEGAVSTAGRLSVSSQNQMTFQRGDLIGVAGNHWDGYSKGVNRRTAQNGLYPSFKVADTAPMAPFALFEGFDPVGFFAN